MNSKLDCQAVDELDAAFALGALPPDEARAVAEHLATCAEPHAQLRAFVGAAEVLAMSTDLAPPSPKLRERVLATVSRTPQEHAAGRAPAASAPGPNEGRGWLDWLSPRVARPLAIAAVVAVLAVGGWNLALQSQLGEQDHALRAVAAAISGGDVAYRVEGRAGRGYVVDTPGSGAALVVAGLGSLPAGQLYELWLLDAAGAPVAVGTFKPGSDVVAVVPVDRDLTGYTAFAVTVEAKRVAAPTGEPVIVGSLKAS
ncbi:MAG: anti-sigma factor [Chloroflexota bacterium]